MLGLKDGERLGEMLGDKDELRLGDKLGLREPEGL